MDTFEYKYSQNEMTLRYAKGKSLMTGDEIHPYYEILYYISGNALLFTEKFEAKLEEKSLIIIPKECYHKFKICDQKNYTRLFIHFTLAPKFEALYKDIFSDIKIITPNTYTANIIERILEILSNSVYNELEENLINSAFPMLLAELAATPLHSQPILRQDGQLITECIKFIDNRFCTKISVLDIAREMGVSPSTLHLCFKEHLGTSVYRYITEKRLIHAHKQISKGKSPTKIYADCGYNDYPTFYKAYKKKFGTNPCKTKGAI